jgi:hypothetical protein
MDQINSGIAGMTQAPTAAGTNPNNPFAAAPIPLSELMLRAAGSILPPPGQMRVPKGAGGALLGGALRMGSGVAGILGQEMGTNRLDPLLREQRMAQWAAEQEALARGGAAAPAGQPDDPRRSSFDVMSPTAIPGMMAPREGVAPVTPVAAGAVTPDQPDNPAIMAGAPQGPPQLIAAPPPTTPAKAKLPRETEIMLNKMFPGIFPGPVAQAQITRDQASTRHIEQLTSSNATAEEERKAQNKIDTTARDGFDAFRQNNPGATPQQVTDWMIANSAGTSDKAFQNVLKGLGVSDQIRYHDAMIEKAKVDEANQMVRFRESEARMRAQHGQTEGRLSSQAAKSDAAEARRDLDGQLRSVQQQQTHYQTELTAIRNAEKSIGTDPASLPELKAKREAIEDTIKREIKPKREALEQAFVNMFGNTKTGKEAGGLVRPPPPPAVKEPPAVDLGGMSKAAQDYINSRRRR